MRRLKQIVPVISVSILALRHQNAELDGDVASVLAPSASEPLDGLVSELEFLVEDIVVQKSVAGRASA